jgi:flagellar hook assembly protein FlgD
VKWNATPDNNFRIEYKPESTIPDGTYTLKIDAEDLSGNKAGPAPYAIRFQVVNKPTFTNFYPYPNPFSTSMKFVFTLTGNSVPDDILIRIMTITGTVVKEIRKEELGMIKIGNNISDFAWDGRDQYGDQLANGVYLYKVYIRDNEQNFEKSKTAGDKNFKHDIGKIYLMR